MATRYCFVVDHGELYRMTEVRYRRYLLSGTDDKFPDAASFGVCLGTATTVNGLKPDDFRDLFNREFEATEGIALAVRCPVCEAEVGLGCNRLGKRWETVLFRGTGASQRDQQRKTLHRERVVAGNTHLRWHQKAPRR